MKTTKSKITKLIQEVTQEILQEHLAQVVPNRQIGEASNLRWWNVSLDRPGAGWSEVVQARNKKEAMEIANKKHSYEDPADTAWETEDPKKKSTTTVSNIGVNTPPGRNTGPNPQYDIKRFARDVSEKLRSKFVKTGEHVIIGRLCDAVRQMIEHKMNKEGWGIIDTEYNESNNLNEISDSEANPENEFLMWVKKAQPGLSSNDLAYDIAENAFKAGFEEGVSWGRSYGADDVRRGYGPTGLRGDPQ